MTGRAREVPGGDGQKSVQAIEGMVFRTQQVDVLVDGIALDGRVAELLNELLLQVLDVDLLSTNGQSLLLSSLEVLCISLVSILLWW